MRTKLLIVSSSLVAMAVGSVFAVPMLTHRDPATPAKSAVYFPSFMVMASSMNGTTASVTMQNTGNGTGTVYWHAIEFHTWSMNTTDNSQVGVGQSRTLVLSGELPAGELHFRNRNKHLHLRQQ